MLTSSDREIISRLGSSEEYFYYRSPREWALACDVGGIPYCNLNYDVIIAFFDVTWYTHHRSPWPFSNDIDFADISPFVECGPSKRSEIRHANAEYASRSRALGLASDALIKVEYPYLIGFGTLSTELVQQLCSLLQDEAENVRDWASLCILGLLTCSESTSKLARSVLFNLLQRRPEAPENQSLIRLLAKCDKQSIHLLINVTRICSGSDRDLAIDLLAMIGLTAIPEVARLAARGSQQERQIALQVLSRIGGQGKKRKRKTKKKKNCPVCGFSYAWDGEKCGHCRGKSRSSETSPAATQEPTPRKYHRGTGCAVVVLLISSLATGCFFLI